MNFQKLQKYHLWRTGSTLAAIFLMAALGVAGEHDRGVFVLTSTNNAIGNDVVVFKLDTMGMPSLSWVDTLATGGNGGASTNAGILQFKDDMGAVANYGSNNVTRLMRYDDSIGIGATIKLAPGCVKPDSVALTKEHLFVVGANCAESHAWPAGYVDGSVVGLADPSAAQIAVGKNWAAVTLSSGHLLQLPLTHYDGALSGMSAAVTLPMMADMVPLGAAFWDDLLGFNPAHSPDSFALVDEDRNVFPVAGPTPSYPSNAPCWLAKGPGSAWYSGNSPGEAISIFFSDAKGGVFYKSIPLPGPPSDITVSRDHKWLAVIYVAGGEGYVAVYAIDAYGDLTHVVTSNSIGVAGFNGVAFSQ
jgi:hypothetical protein